MATFIVDGKEKTLEMRDANGIDWSNDFIGNTQHEMQVDDDGRYIASQEDYDWWAKTISAHLAAEVLIEEYKSQHGRTEVEECLSKTYAYDTDLDSQPASVEHALTEWFS